MPEAIPVEPAAEPVAREDFALAVPDFLDAAVFFAAVLDVAFVVLAPAADLPFDDVLALDFGLA